MVCHWPETGFSEINCDLPEADFWAMSLRFPSLGHNFRVAPLFGRQRSKIVSAS